MKIEEQRWSERKTLTRNEYMRKIKRDADEKGSDAMKRKEKKERVSGALNEEERGEERMRYGGRR